MMYNVFLSLPGGYDRYKRYGSLKKALKDFELLIINDDARNGTMTSAMVTKGKDPDDIIITEWDHELGIILPIPSDEWFGGWAECTTT